MTASFFKYIFMAPGLSTVVRRIILLPRLYPIDTTSCASPRSSKSRNVNIGCMSLLLTLMLPVNASDGRDI